MTNSTTKSELAFQPISDLQRELRSGVISSHDILDSVLARIRRFDHGYNSFITLLPEETLRRHADQADRARKLERYDREPLSGIPIAIKDNTYVSGIRCTGGSRVLESFTPRIDATAVSKLKSSGAIIIGKTNLHEFARGTTNVNPHFGTTKNPWGRDRISGGSSGGSATAVSMGFACSATGTDTGGSIRVPAALCGVVGFKPTYDKISREGVIPLSWSLDHVGPLTRTVEDAITLTRIMGGETFTTWNREGSETIEGSIDQLHGIKIGSPSIIRNNVQPKILSLFNNSLHKFEELRATIFRNVSIPHFEHVRSAVLAITFAEGTSVHDRWFKVKPNLYGNDVRSAIEAGYSISATQYLKALRFRSLFCQTIEKIFGMVDILALPTVPIVAPKLGEEVVEISGKSFPLQKALSLFTSMFNFSGNPAISIPMGLVEGLPAGIQLVAEHNNEDILVRVAMAFENISGFKNPKPPE